MLAGSQSSSFVGAILHNVLIIKLQTAVILSKKSKRTDREILSITAGTKNKNRQHCKQTYS